MNGALSSASRKLRTISAWLSFSCSGKSGDVDGLETRQRLTSMFEIVGNRFVRKIAQPIVVAIVPNLGGKFRLGAQRVLPLIGEQTIEFGSPGIECLLGSPGEEWDGQSCGERQVHKQ